MVNTIPCTFIVFGIFKMDWKSHFAPSKLVFYFFFWGSHITLFAVGW